MARAKQLPSEKDLLSLPRWARVALAARSARRVQPLLLELFPTASARQIQTVEKAIALAEALAAEAPAWTSDTVVDALARAARAAKRLEEDLAKQGSNAGFAALAAFWSAQTAGDACNEARTRDAASAVKALEAAARLDTDGSVVQRIAEDYALLQRLASQEQWTKATPVAPGVFGRR
jgi:hypothetical protein